MRKCPKGKEDKKAEKSTYMYEHTKRSEIHCAIIQYYSNGNTIINYCDVAELNFVLSLELGNGQNVK